MTLFFRVGVAAMLGGLLGMACSTPDPNAPPSVAYDRVACDQCGMLVSDPHYSAALVERDQKLRVFDDPGCLIAYVFEKKPAIAQMWFHDSRTAEAEWFRESEVAFTTGAATPMGSGLSAVPAGTEKSLGFGEASGRIVSLLPKATP